MDSSRQCKTLPKNHLLKRAFMNEFMNIDFHLMLSLNLTFDVFINLLYIYYLRFYPMPFLLS